MKTNGLSSNTRTLMKKVNRHSALVSSQERILAAKDKQKALRLMAERASSHNVNALKGEVQKDDTSTDPDAEES